MTGKAVRHTYAAAGVNIDIAARAKKLIGKEAKTTYRPEVLGGVGFFGGLFELKGYQQPVLVSSVDGVGTKLKIAVALGNMTPSALTWSTTVSMTSSPVARSPCSFSTILPWAGWCRSR